MKKSSIPLYIALITLLASAASAQTVGLGASFLLKQAAGTVDQTEQRLTPYLYGVVPRFGSVRLEWAPSALSRQGDKTDESIEVNRYGVRLGMNGGALLGNHYLLLSWNRVSIFEDGYIGDSEWNEWGVGVGGIWPLSPNLALFAEAEHVWCSGEREQQSADEVTIDRRGWQLQLGFVAFVY